MHTDIPLKRLTQRCPHDLLPLVGATGATVLGVETLELPMSKSSLDCVLHLRAADGRDYLQIIEWQGWTDPVVLWRGLSYLGWVGQHRRERPILLTIIYLKPSDDVGDTLRQEVIGQTGWMVQLPCVRLWQQDAQAAVASGAPGLMALAPLMQGATAALVETAAQQLIQTTAPPLQAELLAALGIFAEPFIATERLLKMITKERLMASDLFSLVYQDQLTELAQERERWQQELTKREQEREQELIKREQELLKREQEREQELIKHKQEHEQQLLKREQEREQQLLKREQEREQELIKHKQELLKREQDHKQELARDERWRQTMQKMVEDALIMRFPAAPLKLLLQVRQIRESDALQALHRSILGTNDLTALEQTLAAAVPLTQATDTQS